MDIRQVNTVERGLRYNLSIATVCYLELDKIDLSESSIQRRCVINMLAYIQTSACICRNHRLVYIPEILKKPRSIDYVLLYISVVYYITRELLPLNCSGSNYVCVCV